MYEPLIRYIKNQIDEHNDCGHPPCNAIEIRFSLNAIDSIAQCDGWSSLPRIVSDVPIFYVEAPPNLLGVTCTITCLNERDQEEHRCLEAGGPFDFIGRK